MSLSERQVLLFDLIVQSQKIPDDRAVTFILGKIANYIKADRMTIIGESKNRTNILYEYSLNSEYNADVINIPRISENLKIKNYQFVVPKPLLEGTGLRSVAVFNLHTYEDVQYYLTVEDYAYDRIWNSDEMNFLNVLANLVSIILVRRVSLKQLMHSQKVYEAVLNNVDMYIFVVEPQNNTIIFANKYFKDAFGGSCENKNFKEYLNISYDRTLKSKYMEIYFESKEEWLAVSYNSIQWFDGETALLFTCYSITDKKTYEDKIKWMAYTDHLTGLPNRYRCDIVLRQVISSARQAGKEGYAMFIDMDDFKIVNDCYGHDYGDGVLISLANFLKESFYGDNYVFRFGGDEFIILISHTNADKIHDYLKLLSRRGNKPWHSGGKEFYCTLSIGVVPFPIGDGSVTTVLKYADIAMYEAKRRGKNKHVFYNKEQNADSQEKSEMAAQLRWALDNNFQGFEILYQPYINIKTKTTGAEALLRINTVDGKHIMPSDFIPIAEYLGFMPDIDDYVMRSALNLCKEINNNLRVDFNMSINLSNTQFKQKEIVGKIEGAIKNTGVMFSNISIGVNESFAIMDIGRLDLITRSFNNLGIQVVLDDFGAGNTSFIHLDKLPVNVVKVSSKLTHQINNDSYVREFIKLMVKRAHSLSKLVCMNGVETQAQYDFCLKNKVDIVQGFYFYKPGTVETLKKILAEMG